jgi:anaerobic selenocysteine-containing dehydrogenase
MIVRHVITEMERRNFFKILTATGAGVITSACGPNTDQLIPLLVPEGQIVPGEEQWHPAVCNECAAGCGTIVRVMEGRRIVETKDGPARERAAAIKKIEGNPLDPISGGKLCARGQAAVQALYHPDRLRSPKKRSGDRGSGKFMDISWDDAIAEAAGVIRKADPASIVFLMGSQVGTRSLAIERFMAAIKGSAPVVCALDDHAAERAALGGLPLYDVANATHILSVGADWLGSWISPVYYTRQYGEFRRSRDAVRGKLIHAESRMSLTAAAADRWIPIKPGTESHLLRAVRYFVANDKGDVTALAAACGVSLARIEETAKMLMEAQHPLVIGGASIVHSNSVDAIRQAQRINDHLGVKVLLTPAKPVTAANIETIAKAKVMLIDGADPAYTVPGARALLQNATVITFSPFIDDTAAYADLILPDHHYLESETALLPSIAPVEAVTVGVPFARPLYQSRAVEQTLADLATELGVQYERITAQTVAASFITAEQPFAEIARAGGASKQIAKPVLAGTTETLSEAAPTFSGDPAQFPLNFQAYLSTQFHDGRSSNLPWMQELPDPASSAMWGLPVEIDPKTAVDLNIKTGDRVRVESPHGSLEAPAYVNPAAIPGVVSMAIGDGHTHYTRYASKAESASGLNRGANPISILDPATDPVTGAVLTGGTRVRLTRKGEGMLIQYSVKDTEHHKDAYR